MRTALTPCRLLCLLWVLALLRLLPGGQPSARPAAAERLIGLPARLEGELGRPLPLTPSEQLLGRGRPGVRLERRRYGSSEVALLTTRGLKELHPPSVCLRAAGLEVVERGEELSRGGCLGWMRVRRPGAPGRFLHFIYLFFDGQQATCSFWRRSALSVGQQLTGRPARWSTLQVLDADPARARRRLLALLASTTIREGESL